MRRVVLLGRGGAGKSTFAGWLGAALDLPVVELDALFRPPDLTPVAPGRWAEVQEEPASEPRWLLDGDLGPYDVLRPVSKGRHKRRTGPSGTGSSPTAVARCPSSKPRSLSTPGTRPCTGSGTPALPKGS
ncbi:hypothetical protein AB0F91_06855 [Amycolatopsis sp. NPDC023774]|uniref:hypothetical protein n=1 Tax=Amycolatopsis sp. NPDC023774 TaxID=3155015 RepID=UPI0033D33299